MVSHTALAEEFGLTAEGFNNWLAKNSSFPKSTIPGKQKRYFDRMAVDAWGDENGRIAARGESA